MNLAELKPSTASAIPLDVLRKLPVGPGAIYVRPWPSQINDIIRITGWNGEWYDHEAWNEDLGDWEYRDPWGPECEGSVLTLKYPRLRRVSFAMTEKAIRDRTKTVTRRKPSTSWPKPGALFLAVDKLRTRKSVGLGVFRVVSSEVQSRHELFLSETLTAAELAREGFPGAAPDEFWTMLQKHGNVVSGKTCRIEFEAV